MKTIIHRGSHEIGGSCVEIKSGDTRIIIDIGKPLVDDNGNNFDFRNYKNMSGPELVKYGILPDVDGLYSWNKSSNKVDALLISHSHQDHYGFIDYIDDNIPVFLGKATKKIIDITVQFTPVEGEIKNPQFIKSGDTFKLKDFKITPYLMDHSAFDAYAYLIQAEDKNILYSGDFRDHGRKSKAFYWFLYNIPENIDVLLLEGTSFGRDKKEFNKEKDIEKEMVKISNKTKGLVLFHQSSQNIDRIVSFYRASLKTDRLFAVDIYTAHLLTALNKYNENIPYPSQSFSNIRVFYPFRLSNYIASKDEELLYKFTKYKITNEEIAKNPSKVMLLVRPTMLSDLKKINAFDDASYIYSLWKGYQKEDRVKKMIDYIKDKNIEKYYLHTSGHASKNTLEKLVNKIKPKKTVPIHTFYPEQYKNFFDTKKVKILSDGELLEI